MNTTLLVTITGGTYQRLDIYEDIPISLVIQQSDLTDLTARRVPYSKTISIPDTQNNARIFEHYYEVNGLDFNPLNKLPCVVQYRGTDIFTGVLRLNAVIETLTSRTYEVYILGDAADFASDIKNLTLQDIQWSDLLHEQSYSAVTTSWEAKDNDTDGLFGGKIIYPLIHYGLEYQSASATTAAFSFSFGQSDSFSTSGNPMPVQYFKPAIRVKEVLDRIFDLTPYNIESEFFDTKYFKSIYMDTFQNGLTGLDTISAVTNQNIFRAFGETPLILRYEKDEYLEIPLQDNLAGAYDPLDNYSNLLNGFFTAPYQGDYGFNLRFNYRAVPLVLFRFFSIEVYKTTTNDWLNDGTLVYSSPSESLFFNVLTPPRSVNLFFNLTLQPGERVKAFVKCGSAAGTGNPEFFLLPYDFGGVTDEYILWDLYYGPDLSASQTVDIRLGLPNYNLFEFIKSMITMFNLVISQDENEKILRIEPYNWFYNDSDRPVQDWTNRIDRSQEYRIEPLSFDLPKENVWTCMDTGDEYLNKLYRDKFDFVYGRYKYTTTNNIFSGIQEYVIPFGAVPTSGLTNATNFVIPKFYYENNNQEIPYAKNPHLFFWTGNRYAYTDEYKTVPGYWWLLSGNTPVQQTTYPCVSHITNLDLQVDNLISDLNFISTFDFYGNSNNQIEQFTQYDLYNTFWSTFVDNIYTPQTRRIKCRVFMTPIDVYDTTLRDKIWIKDAYYTIEKINEADLVNKKLTEVQLIKDVNPYYKVIPPAPVYPLSGNTPYPPVEPTFITECYVSTDKTAVCNGTASIETITTFGTGILQNFRKVYRDTGTALVLLNMGEYLRQTTTSDMFVVADTYGRILEQDC